jgi:hypothetical protein
LPRIGEELLCAVVCPAFDFHDVPCGDFAGECVEEDEAATVRLHCEITALTLVKKLRIRQQATHHFRNAEDDDIFVPFFEIVKRTEILPSIARLKVTHYVQLRSFQVSIDRLAVVVDADCMIIYLFFFISGEEIG